MPKMGFQDDYYLGGETVAGGQRPDLFSTYYQTQGNRNPYAATGNPMLDKQAAMSGQRDLNDRKNLQDLYGQLQNQANGGITPQQQQQLAGFQSSANMAGSAAMTAPGGARARAAGMGSLVQQSGVQGAQNQQQASMLQAQDKLSAQSQMQQVASMQRAQDLESQGLTADDAYRQAQLELRARGLNTQRQLGYAGLENDAMGQNMQAFLNAYRRSATRGKQTQDNQDAWLGRSASAAGSLLAAGA